MARLKIICVNGKTPTRKIAEAVYKTANQTDDLKAELLFTDLDGIRKLNKEHRGVDAPTDVLSFPTLDGIRGKIIKKEDYPLDLDGNYIFIGSAVICADKVKEQAKEIGHSEEREKTYLLVHSLFHLLGYDHEREEDKKEMREMEKKALAILGIEE